MATLAQRRAAREAQEKAQKTAPLGSGERFAAVEKSARLGGARNPATVAAAIGRKKFGKSRFQKLALAARKKAARKVFK